MCLYCAYTLSFSVPEKRQYIIFLFVKRLFSRIDLVGSKPSRSLFFIYVRLNHAQTLTGFSHALTILYLRSSSPHSTRAGFSHALTILFHSRFLSININNQAN